MSISLLLVFTLAATNVANAQKGDVYTNDDGVALMGYDMVSYFENSAPKMGRPVYSINYHGATYHFNSKQHMKAFRKNPDKYLPRYGGYCAYAMGVKGRKVPSDPRTYKMIDGDLYLFFNGKIKGKKMNTKKPWNKKQTQLMPKADKNWSKLESK